MKGDYLNNIFWTSFTNESRNLQASFLLGH